MDTSDSTLVFDTHGRCEYCNNYYENIQPNWHPGEKGVQKIMPLIERIKKEGHGKTHDCLIGISGGLDSSYVAYIAKEKFGLRPLLFHCDAGWNSDIGVGNIQKIADGLNLDLFTEVINWEEMRDLQRAFFKAQVPFIDVPQDLGLFSALYNFAAKNGFKYVITGGNNSTECVRESIEWTYHTADLRYVRDIHRQFGDRVLDTFPMCDIFKYKFYYRWVKGVRVIKLLDSVKFNKTDAIRELEERFGWTPYQQKHYESRFTRFFESYWTPKKFGFDKRRVYLSSEILSGQITREEALKRIATPELSEELMSQDFEYVATKLNWSVADLQEIFDGDNKNFRDYKNNFLLISFFTKMATLLGLEKRLFR